MIKRSLAMVGAALVATTLALAGTPATAQPIPLSPDDKTVTRCIADGDTKKVVSHTRDGLTWTITVKGDKPLCNPFYALATTWQLEQPPSLWPQINPRLTEMIAVQQPGTYAVEALSGCGQYDVYAERDEATLKKKIPAKLLGPNNPSEPRFLHDFSKGPNSYYIDEDLTACKPVKPDVDFKVEACVAAGEQNGKVTVTVTNPNRNPTKYNVQLGGLPVQSLTIAAGESDEVVFEGVAAGDYWLKVSDSNGLRKKKQVMVEECPPPTTTTTVPPETTTTTTVPPETSTTTTTPGIAPVSNNGDLAETGASGIFPMAISALVLIAAGFGAMLFMRRRKANN